MALASGATTCLLCSAGFFSSMTGLSPFAYKFDVVGSLLHMNRS